MPDYGITQDELPEIATNERVTMGGLFSLDPVPMSYDDSLTLLQKAFR